MIGLKELKMQIVEQILYFIQDLHINDNNERDYMHIVLYGSPGTGKTELAKIIGKIYSKLNILSKGTFTKVTRSDLIGGFLGQTAIKTAEVIQHSLGGVLFIDEAYSLGNYELKDGYAKECIDTLCESLSFHKNDLIVIIAGYENEIKNCFFAYNQGLESRFTWRFKMDNYTADNLFNIFIKKVKDIGWKIITPNVAMNGNESCQPNNISNTICVNWFAKNAHYFEYFGRDIEILLSKTKIAHSKRVFGLDEHLKKMITLQDLENGLKVYLRNENVINRVNNKYFTDYKNNTIYT
jgi:Holliday junction resolvasome RuvABC ATP-dependent DNA helicase subunit